MKPEALAYLKTRLDGIKCEDCAEAAQLVANAQSSAVGELSIRAERDLCHAVWGRVSRALDVADLKADDYLLLDAMEAEMAGRVLTARLATGELVKAA